MCIWISKLWCNDTLLYEYGALSRVGIFNCFWTNSSNFFFYLVLWMICLSGEQIQISKIYLHLPQVQLISGWCFHSNSLKILYQKTFDFSGAFKWYKNENIGQKWENKFTEIILIYLWLSTVSMFSIFSLIL